MNRAAWISGWMLLLSGAAALSHQLLWTRRMVDVLGAGPGTFARVVGVFFAGLALGAAWAAMRPVRPSRAWLRVALAEGSVAVLVLPVLAAVPIGDALRPILGNAVVGWVLPMLVIAAPAFAMGVVFPAMVTAVFASGRTALLLYMANTAGGILGLVVMTVWCLPWLGLDAACLATGSVNGIVAILALLQKRPKDGPAPGGPGGAAPVLERDAADPWGRRGYMLAFASGAWVLGLEVVLQQHFAQVTINSQFSGATVLGSVLVALVAGSMVAAFLGPKVAGSRVWLGWMLAVAGLAVALEPRMLAALRPGLVSVPYTLSAGPYYIAVGGLALVLVVPGVMAMGAVFPALLRGMATGPSAGVTIARLLAVNGIGGWIGAELMSMVLLPGLGLWLPMAVWGAMALGLVLVVGGLRRAAWGGLCTCLGVVGVMAVGMRGLPQVSPVKGSATVDVRSGREGVVATMKREDDDWWITFNNSYTLGGSRAQSNQERQAHLPLLLHGRAKTVGVLGLATGSTLGGVTLHPGVEKVVVAELSPLVTQYSREYFRRFNRDAISDPRVEVRVEDARLMVRDRPQMFDVVVGDLFLPWRTGEGRMFSREHFASVRRSLKPGGLYCQWLPLFQLTRPQVEGILRTLQQEFPAVIALRGDFYAELPILGLVAFEDDRKTSELDWNGINNACAALREGRHGRVRDGLVRHPEGVAMCVVGDVPLMGRGAINTLGNGWIEWDAGRNIVGLRSPWFVGVPAAEAFREWHRLQAPRMPLGLRSAHDAGQFYLTLEVAACAGGDLVKAFKVQVGDRLPPALREDPMIDWKLWPSRVKPGPGGSNPVP
jgi:spermidine synthase